MCGTLVMKRNMEVKKTEKLSFVSVTVLKVLKILFLLLDHSQWISKVISKVKQVFTFSYIFVLFNHIAV